MIRPSTILKPLGMDILEEVRATAAAGVVILLAAAICRHVEDRIEARAEARAATIQAAADDEPTGDPYAAETPESYEAWRDEMVTP